ncbi:MAG: TIGR04282 family arsenosugar biosynthesis glycosyltransferase [Melioribacteraceae bacterium]|nr:TIGR04282 family arsenosugar biosynthesis glycosyltransferase [Melioribacteraceae bacterium]
MFKYSVIIPTFNEAIYIRDNIRLIKKLNFNAEIIIADGGSNDDTLKIAEEENVKLINCRQGRGIQLNKGAEIATGYIFCFLHADTFLPANAFELLDKFFDNVENQICRFRLGFDVDHWLFDRYTFFSKYDSIFTRFGDMCITVRKDFYNQLGGFPNWITFEDVDFLKRASKNSKVIVLNSQVASSARAFVKFGLINQQLFNGYLLTKYLLGFRKFISENIYYRKKIRKSRTSIIVFARYPVEGKVKTRLASTIGARSAANIYKKIAKNVINEIKSVPNSNKYIFYSEEKENGLIKKWLGKRFYYAHQNGDDLGERMQNAFRIVFGHSPNKVIIVGTDTPDLSADVINNAIDVLDKSDIVIGPAKDGGYFLLGMRKFYPELFQGIQYSTDTVFDETIKKINSLGLTFNRLNELQDIDTEGDLVQWIGENKKTKLKKEVESVYRTTYRKAE